MKTHFHRFLRHGHDRYGIQRWWCAGCGTTVRRGPEEVRVGRFRELDNALRRRRGPCKEQPPDRRQVEIQRQRQRRSVYLVETGRFEQVTL